jgi:DNA-binding transcriptional ArsR family regulator
MKKPQALTALQALAHQDRLEVMHLLLAHCKAGLAAGEIGRQLGLAPSRLSFHLSSLENAGLIRSEKVARNVIYQSQASEIGALLGWLLRDCCRDNPQVLACCNRAAAVETDPSVHRQPDQLPPGIAKI